jgi:aryl-alcohol dehydrogenase-like predicted oxidoreductase
MQHSLVERGIERELLPMAQHRDLAVTAWSPLDVVRDVANEAHATPAQGEAAHPHPQVTGYSIKPVCFICGCAG